MVILEHIIDTMGDSIVLRDVRMKKLFVVSLVALTLTACLDNAETWNGSYNQLPELGKSCAISWVDNLYSIEQAEEAIHTLEFKPEKLIVLKSGTSDMASYSFTAIMEVKGKTISIVSSPRYEKAIITMLNNNIFNELETYIELVETNEGKVHKGEVVNMSHVPCDFVFYKSKDKTFKEAYIGLFKAEVNIAKAFKNLLSDYHQQGKLLSSPTPMHSED